MVFICLVSKNFENDQVNNDDNDGKNSHGKPCADHAGGIIDPMQEHGAHDGHKDIGPFA